MASIGTDIVFPIEIVEIIVDLVASKDDSEADHPDLKACSLTSRAFVHRCQRHVFRSVTLHDRSMSYDCNRPVDVFVAFIKTNARIADYVQELCYIINDIYFERFDGVPTGLELLPNLRTIDIRTTFGSTALHGEAVLYDWNMHGGPAHISLLRLLRLPTLATLRLNHIRNFSLYDLLRCPNIKNLHLGHHVTVQPPFNDDIPFHTSIETAVSRIKLDTLILGHGWATFGPWWDVKTTNVDPLLDLSNLKKISFYINQRDIHTRLASVQLILQEIPRVEKIHFTFNLVEWHKLPGQYISSMSTTHVLQKLKQLNVDISISGRGVNYETTAPAIDPLCGICTGLENLAGKNCIEVIRLRIEFLEEQSLMAAEWGRLESVLLAPGWPYLKQVDLDILPTLKTRPYSVPPPRKLEKMVDKKRKIIEGLPHTQFHALAATHSITFNFFSPKKGSHGLPLGKHNSILSPYLV